MTTRQDDLLRSDDPGPRLAAWMASTAPSHEPAGLVAVAVERAMSVRQRPAFLVRLRLSGPTFGLPDLSRRAQFVFLAGLLVFGAGAAASVGDNVLNSPTPTHSPTVVAGSSNSLIVLTPDGRAGRIRVTRPDGELVGVVDGSTNGCGRHVLVAGGRSVAFVFQGLPLTIAPLDGSDPITVYASDGDSAGWAFSPDRTRFAFLDGTYGRSDLTIVSLLDGSATVIARDLPDASLSMSAWSANNTLAIATVSRTGARIDLIDADGTNRGSLSLGPLTSAGPGIVVSWSPDGTLLAYKAWGHAETRVLEIATGRSTLVATADGHAVKAWTSIANAEYFLWTPDGREVAYAGNGRYAFLDLATGASRIVAEAMWMPYWSPDGSRVAFVGQGDPRRVTTYRADLSGRVDQMVDDGVRDILAWSPDSQQIAVVSGSDLDLLDPDGIEPPIRISKDVAPNQGCLTWFNIETR